MSRSEWARWMELLPPRSKSPWSLAVRQPGDASDDGQADDRADDDQDCQEPAGNHRGGARSARTTAAMTARSGRCRRPWSTTHPHPGTPPMDRRLPTTRACHLANLCQHASYPLANSAPSHTRCGWPGPVMGKGPQARHHVRPKLVAQASQEGLSYRVLSPPVNPVCQPQQQEPDH